MRTVWKKVIDIPTLTVLTAVVAAIAVSVDEVFFPTTALRSQNEGIDAILTFVIWIALATSLATGSRGNPSDKGSGHPYESGALLGSSYDRTSRRWVQIWFLLGLAVVCLTYRGIFGLSPLSYGDWGYLSRSTLTRYFFPFPQLWTPQVLGTNNIIGAPQYLLMQVTAILALFGVPFAVSERLIYFFPDVILLYAAMFFLSRQLRLSAFSSVACGVFVSCNSYQISLIAGGWVTVGLAELMLAVLLLLGSQLLVMKTTTRAVTVAVALSVAIWVAPQFALLDLVSFVLFAVFYHGCGELRRNIRTLLKSLLMCVAVTIGLQAAWLLPVLSGDSPSLPAGYQTSNALAQFSFQSLIDGLAVVQPAWPSLVAFTENAAPLLALVVPLIVLVGMRSASAYRREVFPLVLLYLGTAALSSGTNGPFRSFNLFVFSSVPGGSLFRNPVLYLGVTQTAGGLLVGELAHVLEGEYWLWIRDWSRSAVVSGRDWFGSLRDDVFLRDVKSRRRLR